jgi:predicted acetyltransferase
MSMTEITLIAPTVRLRASWLAAREEWGRDAHQDGAGLHETDDVDSEAGFAAWVSRLEREAVAPDEGRVPATYWWIASGDTYLGAISLRHSLNDFLLRAGGHIGYGVRPSARRRGLATFALGEVLRVARGRGLARVLVCCDDANVASQRTIEHFGGELEDVRDTELGRTRRYWIAT